MSFNLKNIISSMWRRGSSHESPLECYIPGATTQTWDLDGDGIIVENHTGISLIIDFAMKSGSELARPLQIDIRLGSLKT